MREGSKKKIFMISTFEIAYHPGWGENFCFVLETTAERRKGPLFSGH